MEKTITNPPVSQQIDEPHTILKPSLEESVVVTTTTTVVEKTEVSVVTMIRQEDGENEKEGLFGNLVGEDEGLKVNCRDGSLAGENGSCLKPVFDGKTGFLADGDAPAPADPMDICSTGENKIKKGPENEEEDHNFVVGDFVWGKIKSHPWWPGQIYDPSYASDYATTLKRKGRLLVAYFGDGSFSWCSPSQLKPFIDHFQEMSSQSDSKKFVNAVQNVLEVVSRLVEAELMCKFRSQTRDGIENAVVVNRGIKEGTRVPKGNTVKVLLGRVEPVELVSTLKGYATMEPGTRRADLDLELAVLKSFLRAFYTKKGGYLLVGYRDPKCIEGLEEETRSGVDADSDIISPLESPENGDDKLYQKRKQKSVAELLQEDESKIKKAKTSKDGGVKERKRKALVVSVTPESDHETGGGGDVEEETMSPRQRKKSRYLSPPYLSPIGSGRLSVFASGTGIGSGSFKEPKTEPEKVSEKVPETAAKQLEDSSKKSSRRKTRRVRDVSDSQEQKKTDEAVNLTAVLHGLLRAALDPTSFVEKNLPAITKFVSSFRMSAFKDGSDQKKDGEDASDLVFIKRKLEWMSEMVQMCKESEMSADVKASLEGGIKQVLEKVVKMRGK